MSKSIKSIIEEKLKNKKWKTSMISTIAVRKGYKLSPRTVSRIINEGHKPKDSTLRIIAEILGISDGELVFNSKNKSDKEGAGNKLRFIRLMDSDTLYYIFKELKTKPICDFDVKIKGSHRINNVIKLFELIEESSNLDSGLQEREYRRKFAPYFADALKHKIGIFQIVLVITDFYEKGKLLDNEIVFYADYKRSWSKPPSHKFVHRVTAVPLNVKDKRYQYEEIPNSIDEEQVTYLTIDEDRVRKIYEDYESKIEFLNMDPYADLDRVKKIRSFMKNNDKYTIAWRVGIKEFFDKLKKSDLKKIRAHKYFGVSELNQSLCSFLNRYHYLAPPMIDEEQLDFKNKYIKAAFNQGHDAAEVVWQAFLEAEKNGPFPEFAWIDDNVTNPAYKEYSFWEADYFQSHNKKYLDSRSDLEIVTYSKHKAKSQDGEEAVFYSDSRLNPLITTEGFESCILYIFDEKENLIFVNTNVLYQTTFMREGGKFSDFQNVVDEHPNKLIIYFDSHAKWRYENEEM